MGPGGLEPPTSRLSGVRSSQLSYEPDLLGPSVEEVIQPRPTDRLETQPYSLLLPKEQQKMPLLILSATLLNLRFEILLSSL